MMLSIFHRVVGHSYIIFGERPIQVLCPFVNWVTCLLLLLSCSSWYTLDINLLPDRWFGNISSHSIICLFTLSIVLDAKFEHNCNKGISRSTILNFLNMTEHRFIPYTNKSVSEFPKNYATLRLETRRQGLEPVNICKAQCMFACKEHGFAWWKRNGM